jgi:RND family efflux transporter MFP subunit
VASVTPKNVNLQKVFIVLNLKFIILSITLMLMPVGVMAQGSAATVIVEKIKVAQIGDTTPLIARLIATVDSNVAARRNGVVDSVLFQIGDTIKKGQELVRLDDQLINIELRNSEAAVISAQTGITISKARLKLTKNAFDRQSGLKGSVAFSKARFDDLQQEAAQALGELSRAQAQVAVAKAALDRAKYDRKHSVIIAPFDGVAITRNVQPGQYISLGGSVAMLLDLSSLEIEADVPVSLLEGLVVGRELEAVLHDGRHAKATVRTLLPIETVSTRTRPVRLSFSLKDNKPYVMANGETVTILVPVSAVEEVAIVPKDALVQGLDGGWMVFVAEDGKAVPKPVTTGRASAGGLEILSGIKQGDYVVIRGNERLQPNQAINPQDQNGKPITLKTPAKSAG